METNVTKQPNQQLEKVKSDAEKRFAASISIALEFEAKANAIVISDETTLGMANQLLSKIKEHEKTTEDKRVAYKAPYLEAGKMIDKVAKEVLGPLNKALEVGKSKLKAWNDAQEAKQKAALAAVEEKRTKLDKLLLQIATKADACVTPEMCDHLHASISEKFPAVEAYGPYANEAAVEKKRYLDLLILKRDTLKKALAGGAGSTQAVAAMKEAEKVADEVAAEKYEQRQETAEAISEAIVDNTVKSNTRKTWKAVVVSPMSLPREWLCPDMDAINGYMKVAKGSLESGQIINGVKFYQEETPIIK